MPNSSQTSTPSKRSGHLASILDLLLSILCILFACTPNDSSEAGQPQQPTAQLLAHDYAFQNLLTTTAKLSEKLDEQIGELTNAESERYFAALERNIASNRTNHALLQMGFANQAAFEQATKSIYLADQALLAKYPALAELSLAEKETLFTQAATALAQFKTSNQNACDPCYAAYNGCKAAAEVAYSIAVVGCRRYGVSGELGCINAAGRTRDNAIRNCGARLHDCATANGCQPA